MLSMVDKWLVVLTLIAWKLNVKCYQSLLSIRGSAGFVFKAHSIKVCYEKHFYTIQLALVAQFGQSPISCLCANRLVYQWKQQLVALLLVHVAPAHVLWYKSYSMICKVLFFSNSPDKKK